LLFGPQKSALDKSGGLEKGQSEGNSRKKKKKKGASPIGKDDKRFPHKLRNPKKVKRSTDMYGGEILSRNGHRRGEYKNLRRYQLGKQVCRGHSCPIVGNRFKLGPATQSKRGRKIKHRKNQRPASNIRIGPLKIEWIPGG